MASACPFHCLCTAPSEKKSPTCLSRNRHFVHLCCVVAENVTFKHMWPDAHIHSEPSTTFHHCRVGFTDCDGLPPREKQVLLHSTVPSVHLLLQSQLVSVLSEPSQELCLPPLELTTSHMNDHKNILSHSSAWSLSPLHPKPQTYPELGNGDEELNHILLSAWKKHSKHHILQKCSKQSSFCRTGFRMTRNTSWAFSEVTFHVHYWHGHLQYPSFHQHTILGNKIITGTNCNFYVKFVEDRSSLGWIEKSSSCLHQGFSFSVVHCAQVVANHLQADVSLLELEPLGGPGQLLHPFICFTRSLPIALGTYMPL